VFNSSYLYNILRSNNTATLFPMVFSVHTPKRNLKYTGCKYEEKNIHLQQVEEWRMRRDGAPFTVAAAVWKSNQASACKQYFQLPCTVRYLDYNASSGVHHCRVTGSLSCRGLADFRNGNHNCERGLSWNNCV
jgi:hypothetical protein